MITTQTFEEFQATREDHEDLSPILEKEFNAPELRYHKPGCTYKFKMTDKNTETVGWIEKEPDGRYFVDCGMFYGHIGDRDSAEKFLYEFFLAS